MDLMPQAFYLFRPGLLLGLLPRLLGGAGRTGEHAPRSYVRRYQADALVADMELAYLVGVGHATGFHDPQDAVRFTVGLHVLQQDPGIDQRGDDGAVPRIVSALQVGEQ